MGNQSFCLFTRQPAVPLNLSSQQTDFRHGVDPLPFVAGHPKKAAHRGQIAIHRGGFVALLELSLHDAPDQITIDLSE
ncbi:hypothetical protein D3C71_1733900 [compost metagenome]